MGTNWYYIHNGNFKSCGEENDYLDLSLSKYETKKREIKILHNVWNWDNLSDNYGEDKRNIH